MRAGPIARFRVHPHDAMAVVDLVNQSGFSTAGLSFNQYCKLAFDALIAQARRQGIVPERQGFEYEEMLRPVLEFRADAKMHATRAVDRLRAERLEIDEDPSTVARIVPHGGAKAQQQQDAQVDALIERKGQLYSIMIELEAKSPKGREDEQALKDITVEMASIDRQLSKLRPIGS